MSDDFLHHLIRKYWWDTWNYPSRIMDFCFPMHLRELEFLPRSGERGLLLRLRPEANIAVSEQTDVKNDDKQFQVSLNVSQFKPEELEVKVVDNYVVIHGKHEEKIDEHGLISREFTRKYMLPDSCETDSVASSISPNGVLTISAHKRPIQDTLKKEREIPICLEKSKL